MPCRESCAESIAQRGRRGDCKDRVQSRGGSRSRGKVNLDVPVLLGLGAELKERRHAAMGAAEIQSGLVR